MYRQRLYKKEDGTAKISTIDSSKGMDLQAVFMVNTENMPFALEEDENREVALMYIGMTRTIEYLTISCAGESKFTEYFDVVLEKRKHSGESEELAK